MHRHLADPARPRPRRRAVGELPRPARDRPGRGESATEPSVDVFYKITPQLNASLTVNTDFSATEVDDRQVNLTRFSLFFPERRDFFLQDVDIFLFGRLQQDGRPFFSRRLGINSAGQPVPLDVGGKVSGRIGRFDVGTLAVQQEAYRDPSNPDRDRRRGDGARRARRCQRARGVERRHDRDERRPDVEPRQQRCRRRLPLFEQPAAPAANRSRATRGSSRSNTPGLDGDDTAFGLGVRFPSSTGWRGDVDYMRVEDNFYPALGFVRRTGIDDLGLEVGPRGGRGTRPSGRSSPE